MRRRDNREFIEKEENKEFYDLEAKSDKPVNPFLDVESLYKLSRSNAFTNLALKSVSGLGILVAINKLFL